MKKIIISLSIASIAYFFHSCATVGSPSGGAKDTTAPQVKSIFPENKSTNFKANFVQVEYTEYLDLNSVDKELIIVPKVEDYEIEKGTKSIKIKFKKPLEKNTTYQIFFRKGIKDVNEGNVCKLKSLVFSTGSYVDSLSISGVTKSLHSQMPVSSFVGLYKKSDTLDFKKHKPYYWTYAEGGEFSFENLKEEDYEIFAFLDNNKNDIYDKKEQIGYLSKSVNPKTDKTLELKLSPQNLDTLKLVSAIDNKDFYQIKFSKPIYKAKWSDNQVFKIENEKIFVLKGKEDSLVTQVVVEDSTNYEIKTKVSIINRVKPTKTKDFVKMITTKAIPGKKYVLLTERKIAKLSQDSIVIIYDGKGIDVSDIKSVRDSLYFTIPFYKDSISINFKKGAFISVQGDSSNSLKTRFATFDESDYGTIAGKVVYEGDMVLELIKGNKVAYSTRSKVFEAKYLEPGDYNIKVIKDADNNGYWTQGNYTTKKQPEAVYFNPKPLTLKANWELKDVLIKVE